MPRRQALPLLWMAAMAARPAAAQPVPPAVDSVGARIDPFVARPRVLVLTDIANEPDDQMSLVRFLVYSNRLDVEGLVATTSTWMKRAVRPDVIRQVIAAYDSVRPNPLLHQPGFPTGDALRAVVTMGQPGYGMAAVGPDRMSPGAELIVRAADRADPRPLWITAWGGREHARPGAAARARHAPAGRGRAVRRDAARVRDLRPGRCRPVDPPRVPAAALRGHPVVAGRRAVLLRDVDRHQRRPLLPQRPGRRLHDLRRRVGGRAHPREEAVGRPLSAPVLHPRGGHAVLPRPHGQRAGERDEPRVRRLGRALSLAPAVRRAAAVLDAGGRRVPGKRQLARRGRRRGWADVRVGPGDGLALAHRVPARLRGAHGLDGEAGARGEPQPRGHRQRPGGDGATPDPGAHGRARRAPR